jgi:hypothetical protein
MEVRYLSYADLTASITVRSVFSVKGRKNVQDTKQMQRSGAVEPSSFDTALFFRGFTRVTTIQDVKDQMSNVMALPRHELIMEFNRHKLKSDSVLSRFNIGSGSLLSICMPTKQQQMSETSVYHEGERVRLNEGFFQTASSKIKTPLEEAVFGIVVFALPPAVGQEQRFVMVAPERESDGNIGSSRFYRASDLELAYTPLPIFQPGDRVRLRRGFDDTQGCLFDSEAYGVVLHAGPVRNGNQRNVLVANVSNSSDTVVAFYSAAALVHCSCSLRVCANEESSFVEFIQHSFMLSSHSSPGQPFDFQEAFHRDGTQVCFFCEIFLHVDDFFPLQMWMKLWNPCYSVGESTHNCTPLSASLKLYCQHILGWSASQSATRREREQSLIEMFRSYISAKGSANERFNILKFSELHSSISRSGDMVSKGSDPEHSSGSTTVSKQKKGKKGKVIPEKLRESASTFNRKEDARQPIILPFLVLEPDACEDACNQSLDPAGDEFGSLPQWQQQMHSKDVSYADPIDLARLVSGLQDKNGFNAKDHAADLCLLRTFDTLESTRQPKGCAHPIFLNAIVADDASKVSFLFRAYPHEFRVDMSDNMGRTLFHIVADCSDAERCIDTIAEALGEQGRVILDYKSHPSASCRTALHSAAIRGHVKIIERFLQYGASTEILDSAGMTALDLAAKSGMFEAFKVILYSVRGQQRFEISRSVQTMDSSMQLPYLNEIREAQRFFDGNRVLLEQEANDTDFVNATLRWKAHLVNISDEGTKQAITELRKQLLEVASSSESPDTFTSSPLLILDIADDFKESIMRLKCGVPSYLPYNVMKPSAFETEDELKTSQALLFLCLAYSLSFASSPSDLMEQIQKFEVHCDCRTVPVLYWLAWSRCLSQQAVFSKSAGDEQLAIKFLNCFAREFNKVSAVNGAYCGNVDDWITTEEKQKIHSDPLRLSDMAPSMTPSLFTQSVSADDWLKSLSDYQREPFDKLNKMVGLAEVKKTAQFIFDLGQSRQRNEAMKDNTRLNFAFLGKPGDAPSAQKMVSLSHFFIFPLPQEPARLVFPRYSRIFCIEVECVVPSTTALLPRLPSRNRKKFLRRYPNSLVSQRQVLLPATEKDLSLKCVGIRTLHLNARHATKSAKPAMEQLFVFYVISHAMAFTIGISARMENMRNLKCHHKKRTLNLSFSRIPVLILILFVFLLQKTTLAL